MSQHFIKIIFSCKKRLGVRRLDADQNPLPWAGPATPRGGRGGGRCGRRGRALLLPPGCSGSPGVLPSRSGPHVDPEPRPGSTGRWGRHCIPSSVGTFLWRGLEGNHGRLSHALHAAKFRSLLDYGRHTGQSGTVGEAANVLESRRSRPEVLTSLGTYAGPFRSRVSAWIYTRPPGEPPAMPQRTENVRVSRLPRARHLP